MKRLIWLLVIGCRGLSQAAVPDNLVVEGIPEVPEALRTRAARYLEYRTAAFSDWHPRERQVLITTRFADSAQLHLVRAPGGARRQLTFLPEPVAGGRFQPVTGEFIVFQQDAGGGEFYQLYRYDLADGQITQLTDGRSRNLDAVWSPRGRWLAYSSTRRNGRDTDLYVMDPANPASDRRLVELQGGGWSAMDWSPDDRQLLLREYLSINASHLHVLDVATGKLRRVTPDLPTPVAYGEARFAPDGKTLYVTTDRDAEFLRLGRIDLASGRFSPLSIQAPWDVTEFEVSPDGRWLAFVTNEDGMSVLRILDARRDRELPRPRLPAGVITGLKWRSQGNELAFTLSAAQSPGDTYSLEVKRGQLERWTESETGGLDPRRFIEPERVRLRSFDGVEISAWVYRPDPQRFPGPRPVLLSIHGGPEAQARPLFQARNNYYLNELGVALVYPNVRGSSGYGKTFLTLDNGFKREDSVKDIGAVIDWIRQDARLDGARVGVIGGSYGGYMVLASLVHFGERLRCGVDVVGISNFLTFLRNTQDYRRDLRRVEYGDERDEAMRAFLERISPLNQAQRITRPLLVVQGQNDPRVPVTESEQLVKAIRGNGGNVGYLLAKDEGHGFAKKKNADYQFLATILFLQQHLLGGAP